MAVIVPNHEASEGELPDLDVIIATRNRPVLMRAAVEAVLAQSYAGPITVLLVYDQSDPDPGITEAFDTTNRAGLRQVTVHTNRRSPGLAGARNTGLLAASADLVGFCDDDDAWLPDKVTAQVAVLAADAMAEVVCCGIVVNYDGHEHQRTLQRTQITLVDLVRDRLTELHPSTFLMRRKAVVDGFGLVEEQIPGSYAEDYEFLLRAARQHPISNIDQVGVRVLWSKGSYFTGRWATIEKALTWLLDKYPEFEQVPAGRARVLGQIAFAVAAQRQHRQAWRWIGQTLRAHPTEARAFLATMVNLRLINADRVLRALHRSGRGL